MTTRHHGAKHTLFGRFEHEMKRQALSEWRQSELGRAMADVERYSKKTGGAPAGFLGRWIPTAVRAALHALGGPLGDMVGALLYPRGGRGPRSQTRLERELDAAEKLLRAFRPELFKDSGAARRRARRKKRQAEQRPEDVGFTQRAPSGGRRQPREGQVTVQIGGRRRSYATDDPIMTGELIPVTSSNVHSIGFLFNSDDPVHGTLQVRFLQKDKNAGRGATSKVGGPLYYYYGVHPDVFQAFQRAASKGEFVWDRLRVRGTRTGHRYQYDLKAVSQGYVPRKATRYGPNEYFIKRSVRVRRTSGVKTLTSALPDQRVGRIPGRYPPEGFVPRARRA